MFVKVPCIVVFLVALLTVVEAVTCGEVVSAVAPCLGYLRNGGNPPRFVVMGFKQGLGLSEEEMLIKTNV
ncbi:hypothetical protein L1987_03630 [Smallanthus sonchifolius]|uniref:Uncharacterized protein n=1 Tax=Smallanthus sonchifolius TaxID=185202 RepID=A0ACB9KBE7_9ASTR|nr:hypothetical protein L1987_03630 [Smallanthus sonchifolius]